MTRRATGARRAGRPRDRGSIAVMTATMAGGLIALGGTGFDVGAALNAQQQAADVARSSARVGAQELLRSGGSDPDGAAAAARRWLAREGLDGAVTVDGAAVRVELRLRRDTTFLALVGMPHLDVAAQGGAAVADGRVVDI